MVYILRIDVDSSECSPVVQAYRTVRGTARSLGVTRAGTGSVERRKISVGIANEAVVHGVRVRVDSRDRAELVEPCEATGTARTLARAGACAWSFVRREAAISMAY